MKPEEINDSVKKPASQYLLSVSIGVLVILLVSAIAYYGVFQNQIF
jgi:hypothetical protein